ncbi:tRNA-dihydrouridine synthase family protein [Carboxylicivirga sp. N1Y90]|uniref:tRNA-dihydrouridine synthase family protein n=1 Tax=Carboxylicivirga fragile TaxID=3417571 RepID=UPI003D344EF1|nr:tRNA-dihydrouridine synthase family protein [Marinilabiliaceae bacterium N1Y90]
MSAATQSNFYMAPLQGYTNPFYRYAFSKVYGNISKYFTPFIEEGTSFEKQIQYELNPKFTQDISVVPQLVTTDPKFLLMYAERMIALGFDEINLNMGCPFPMLVKRGLGGGMLKDHKVIDALLNAFFNVELPIALSIKMRSGISTIEEGKRVFSVLNNYDIKEVVVHPRLVNQKYSGTVSFEHFDWFYKNTDHQMCANGDINSYDDYFQWRERYPDVKSFMIGRGLLTNPFLINDLNEVVSDKQVDMFKQFHQYYYDLVVEHCINWNQAFNYLNSFWYYPLNISVEKKRLFRRLKKHNHAESYALWLAQVWATFKTN